VDEVRIDLERIVVEGDPAGAYVGAHANREKLPAALVERIDAAIATALRAAVPASHDTRGE